MGLLVLGRKRGQSILIEVPACQTCSKEKSAVKMLIVMLGDNGCDYKLGIRAPRIYSITRVDNTEEFVKNLITKGE